MLEYNDKDHTYFLEGTELPSVTTLLRDCGIINTAFYTGAGADNGTRRHLLTELYDKDTLDWGTVAEEDLPYLNGWIQAKEDLNMEIQGIEQRMYHELLSFAGTIDRLATVGGKPTIIDIKTGQKAKWHELQLILYGLMTANNDQKPNLMTIYLKKTGKYTIQEYDYTNERYAMSAVRVSQWKRRGK